MLEFRNSYLPEPGNGLGMLPCDKACDVFLHGIIIQNNDNFHYI
jgi:hypothetical protein